MTRHQRRPIRLGLAALFVVSPIGVRAQTGVRYLAHQVSPPPEDRRAIQLPGKCTGAAREQWLDIEAENDPSGMSGRSMVRNVCQASITPFLPDPKVASGAAMVIAPGGGTLLLSMDRQGYRVAKWLTERGVAAFVLKYRLIPTTPDVDQFAKILGAMAGGRPVPDGVISNQQASDEAANTAQDGIDAVRFLRANAGKYALSPDRIGIMGFSAGAFTSLSVALFASEKDRPNVVAPIYGALPSDRVPDHAPPIFIAAASDDQQVPAIESVKIYTAWHRANVPAELHLFENGGHGFNTEKQGRSTDQWLELFELWLGKHRFVTRRDK